MLVSVGKAHHFVFDRRAVTWANPFNHASIHWAAVEVIADHVMGFLVGMRDIARYLTRMLGRIAEERENGHWVIAMLLRQHAEVDSARVDTRRGAGFQTAHAQRQFTQTTRERNGRRIASTATAVVIQPDMNFAVEESSDGQHDCFRTEFQSHLGDSANHAIVFHNQIFNRLLEDHQVGLVLKRSTHGLAIEHAIRLSTSGAYRRPFARV